MKIFFHDEVMQYIVCLDYEKYSDQEQLDHITNTQIPYYQERKFVKTTAFLTFGLGRYRYQMGDYDGAIEAFELSPSSSPPPMSTSVRSIFWNAKQYEHTIIASNLRVGETRVADGGDRSICYREAGVVYETPAGRFEGCSVYVYERDNPHAVITYCETWFYPGGGIVRQLVERNGERTEWVLSAYTVKGGEGLLPLATDNSWSYVLAGTTRVSMRKKTATQSPPARTARWSCLPYMVAHVEPCNQE